MRSPSIAVASLICIAALACCSSRAADELAERGVLGYLNEARTNPSGFAVHFIKPHKPQDAAALECYREMQAAVPMPALTFSAALEHSASDLANDMGRSGRVGHVGTDGSTLRSRIERYAEWSGHIGENCSYGIYDPLDIVVSLLIDENVPDRGHRRNILNPHFRFAGVAIRPHKDYGTNCVQDFAEALRPRR